MSWRPDVEVTVAGRDVRGEVLAVTAARGREDTRSQPRAGYLRAVLLEPDPPPTIGDRVRVAVVCDGTPVPLWTGDVTDVEATVDDAGDRGTVTLVELTATGPLARVHRGTTRPDGYEQQLDGERVAAVLVDALAARWETVDDALRWDQLDPGATWRTFDVLDLDDLDPGAYELQANYADRDPWRIVQQAAADGGGVVYETRTGRIGYADSTRRLAEVRARGFVVLPDAAVELRNLRARTALGDVTNRVELTYSTGTVEAVDRPSVRRFQAVLSERVSTRLLHEADATARAELLVSLWSRPARTIDVLPLDLGAHDLTDSDRAGLLALDPGTPIRLRRLPASLTDRAWSGFVEAVAVELDRYRLRLLLTVTPYEFSTFGGRWIDYPDTLRWIDAPAATSWLDVELLL